MIHSARPTVANIVFCCFVLLDLKSGDGRAYRRTDNMCDRPWLWVGQVDQLSSKIQSASPKLAPVLEILLKYTSCYNSPSFENGYEQRRIC